MKYTDFRIPPELSNCRIFYAVIYINKTYKNLEIELDSNDEKIIRFECTCRKNTINDSMNKKQMMCKHLKDFKEQLKSKGYLKKDEDEFVFTNQKTK